MYFMDICLSPGDQINQINNPNSNSSVIAIVIAFSLIYSLIVFYSTLLHVCKLHISIHFSIGRSLSHFFPKMQGDHTLGTVIEVCLTYYILH